MKVTLITATYNSQKYLEDCITSVIRRGYKDIEHIIVDGKSSDKTVDIIKNTNHTLPGGFLKPTGACTTPSTRE